MLATTSDMCHFDWDLMIPFVLMAYRATKHSATSISPNMMLFGREIMEPVDLIASLPAEHTEKEPPQYVLDLKDTIQKAHMVAREELQASVERAKKYYGRKLHQHKYQIGDPVWYFVKGTKRVKGKVPKFMPYFDGPYYVLGSLDDVVYIIQKGPKSKCKIVHHDKLKAYKSREPLDNGWVFRKTPEAPKTESKDNPEKKTVICTDRPKRATKSPNHFGEWLVHRVESRATLGPQNAYRTIYNYACSSTWCWFMMILLTLLIIILFLCIGVVPRDIFIGC